MADELYRTAVMTSDDEFARLRDEWDDLLFSSEADSVFLTWEWLYHWWRHFGGRGRSLRIVAVRRAGDNALVGLAPLYQETVKTAAGYRAVVLRFLGSDRVGSDFMDFIVHPGESAGVTDSIGRCLTGDCREWDGIELSDVGGAAQAPLAGAWLRRKRHLVIESRRSVCPFLRLPGTYEEFLASLGEGLRTELKRKTRHGEGQGRFVYSIEESPVNLAKRIEEIFALHRNSFRIKRYGIAESAFEGDDLVRFHVDVAEAFSRRRWLRIYRIVSQGDPVALLYGFRYKKRLFCYQTGFDVEWRRYSPGMVLLGYAINDCILDGIGEFHFLRGSESYKSRWTTDAVRTVRLTVVRPDLRGLAYAATSGFQTGMRHIRRLMAGEKIL